MAQQRLWSEDTRLKRRPLRQGHRRRTGHPHYMLVVEGHIVVSDGLGNMTLEGDLYYRVCTFG